MLEIHSPAKLNLFLHIVSQREDGYHELQSLFELINLYDTLRFYEADGNSIQITCTNADLQTEDNLISRAAHTLREYAIQEGYHRDHFRGITIDLEKVIPMGAGLGGGSANAACTLTTLNQFWNLHFTRQQLAQLGLTLGADVPIFINNTSAWAEGIGEIQTPVNIKPCHYLVISPPCHASTIQLFKNPNLIRNMKRLNTPEIGSTFDPIEIMTQYSNVFEPVARAIYPEIDHVYKWLQSYGPTALTGSGSSCFAAFESASEAINAYEQALDHWQPQKEHSILTSDTSTNRSNSDQKLGNYRCFLVNSKKSKESVEN